ncbi:MAG: serine hydrolase domain-containing protein [Promethearchaeota archaeon]
MSEEFNTEELGDYLQAQTTADRFSGAVLIAKQGKPIFKEAYGLASKRFNVPNRIDTKFNIGSINKIFTKIAITQLVEKGKLDFENLVGKFLPDFPSDIANKVTINHLLTFTSGMGHYWNERFEASISKLRTVDDFIQLFIDDPLSFEPGEKRQYSNSGYVVLGKIIEVVSGKDYYDYVRENIYKPAGMINSDHYELDKPVPNLAIGYTKDEHSSPDGTLRNNTFLIGIKGSPAGGGYSTVEDMLKFDIALHNNQLLTPEYTRTIFPVRNNTEEKRPPSINIAGGADGISAFFGKFYDLNYTVIVLSNYDPPLIEPVFKKIKTMILE